jgi:dihydroxyacetone kinase
VNLPKLSTLARLTASNIVSIGASLSHVHVPGRSFETSDATELQQSEVEIGMGIHNEPGSERKTTDLPGLVSTLLSHLLSTTDSDRSFLLIKPEDEIVLLVNNLGGVSVLELAGITNEVVEQLEKEWKIKPIRILAGTYMTSLNGLGFSISLLKVQDTGLAEGLSMLELLDAPAEASGWTAAISSETWKRKGEKKEDQEAAKEEEFQPGNLSLDYAVAKAAVTSALNRVIAAEPDVTNYDTIVGDGDCGIGLKRGAEGMLYGTCI